MSLVNCRIAALLGFSPGPKPTVSLYTLLVVHDDRDLMLERMSLAARFLPEIKRVIETVRAEPCDRIGPSTQEAVVSKSCTSGSKWSQWDFERVNM